MFYSGAVGSGPHCMPEKVGMLISADKPWYKLEVHYNNPNHLEGIQDNSGVLITMFPKRQSESYQEAAYMGVGTNIRSMQIPPGRQTFQMKAECHFPNMPPEGVHVFGNSMHAHQIGKKAWTTIHRAKKEEDDENNGEEATFDLGCDLYLDFNMQELFPFQEHITVYPTDTFVTECVYDSSERTKVTRGGVGSTDEMCIGWFLYYPAFHGSQCFGHTTLDVGDGSHVCNAPGLISEQEISFVGEACDAKVEKATTFEADEIKEDLVEVGSYTTTYIVFGIVLLGILTSFKLGRTSRRNLSADPIEYSKLSQTEEIE